MKHTFKFPKHIRDVVKKYIKGKVDEVDPRRFNQEPAYVAALAAKLDGIIYNKRDGYVEIRSTVVDNIAPGAAESWSGADLAITAKISDGEKEVEKAILIQSKLGDIDSFPPSKRKYLKGQIKKTRKLTRSPQVMEISKEGDKREPKIISGNKILNDEEYSRLNLSDYFVRRILTTLDGDTRKNFVRGVEESSLTRLKVLAQIKD